jgi:hypothetical protein
VDRREVSKRREGTMRRSPRMEASRETVSRRKKHQRVTTQR